MGEKQIKINHLLEKLLSGKINSSENEELRRYIQSTYKDQQLSELMIKHWERVNSSNVLIKEANLEHVKSGLLSLISKDEISNLNARNDLQSWKSYFLRIAAVLFIPLLILSGYLYYSLIEQKANVTDQLVKQEVFASPGSRVHFTLPDETEVWLNSASKLEYPVSINNQKQRVVKLSGQGYFKVAHDKTKPFFVETEKLNIKVLGTSFDISSYDDDHQLISTLVDGEIAILSPNGEEVSRLVPGQQATLNKNTNKLIIIDDVDTRLSTSWKDGYLIFKDTPIAEVVKKLERWYNCNIELSESLKSSGLKYTATLRNETLGEVLKMMEISTSVKTEIINRNVKIRAN